MYTWELDGQMAQKIADGIMEIVPYNINIMDKDGYIIASGDKNRINTRHMGAIRAVEKMMPYVIYEDTDTEREGVNIPIIYSNKLVGVIGISGNVEKVMQIGKIVVFTAQLMIENNLYNGMTTIKESRLKDFLYDWIQLEREQYQGEIRDRAKYFKVDLDIPRTAVVFTSKKVRFSVVEQIMRMLEPGEYVVRQKMEEIIILFPSTVNLAMRIEKIRQINPEMNCYVGESSVVVKDSIEKAIETSRLGQAMGMNKEVLYFHEIALEYIINSAKAVEDIENIREIFKKKDTDGILAETLGIYTNEVGDQAKICSHLHIHRNTLSYRMSKIEEITGKNPRCPRDLMYLYIAVIQNATAENDDLGG